MSDANPLTQQDVFALYDIDEMSKFKDLAELVNFVESLNGEEKKQLAQWLSDWRKNSMCQSISIHPGKWKREEISTERIILGEINDKVNHLLKRHQFRLHLIATDKEITNHPEFAAREQSVTRREFIAKKMEDNDYRLSDGNHRAVVLAASGKSHLTLIFPD